MTNQRIRTLATVPEQAIETLEERGYTCWVNRHDTPLFDIYEIRENGVLKWASCHADLFETIATVYAR